MPIYKISNSKAVRIPFLRDGFGNEFKLRDFFADNLEELLGVRFLEKEFQIDGGRMDTIGIDENNCPVIIEYKWKENEEVFAQGLFYLDWLKRNKRHFELLVKSKLGNEAEVNWNDPRVILVAQGFSRYVESAVQQVSNVELKTYALYEDGIVHIENVYGGKGKKSKEILISTIQQSNVSGDSLAQEEITYDVEHHTKGLPEDLREAFETVREKILELPGAEELPLKIGITYRTTRSFVRFEFRKNWIMVLVRSAAYPVEDPKNIISDVTSHGWGFNGKLKMTAADDPEYIFGIIKASYGSTL